MSKLSRYNFIKKYYFNYLVFIKDKDYYLDICKLLNYKLLNINYIVLDKLNIIDKIEVYNNKYFYYYKLNIILNIIKKGNNIWN